MALYRILGKAAATGACALGLFCLAPGPVLAQGAAASGSRLVEKRQAPAEPRQADFARFPEAVEMYAHGRFEEAEALLGAIYRQKLNISQNRRVRFLMGLNAVKLGRWARAAALLTPRLGQDPALKGYTSYYYGVALMRLGRFEEATAIFSGLIEAQTPEPRLAHRCGLNLAEIKLAQGQTEASSRLVSALIKDDEQGEAGLLRARLLAAQGQEKEALAAWRDVVMRSSDPIIRPQAFRKYQEHLAWAVLRSGDDDLAVEFVRLLMTKWMLSEALELANILELKIKTGEACDGLAYEKGRILLYQDRLAEATEHYRQAYLSATTDKNRLQLMDMYAECLRRGGRWEEAAKIISKSSELEDKASDRDETGFWSAHAFVWAGKMQEAEIAIKSLNPRALDAWAASQFYWHQAWYYQLNGDVTRAGQLFEEVARRERRSELASAARYFAARIKEGQGQANEAIGLYRKIASENDYFYYRILSLNRLAAVDPQGEWLNDKSLADLLPSSVCAEDNDLIIKDFFSVDLPPAPDMASLEKVRLALAGLAPPACIGPRQAAFGRLASLAAAGALDLAVREAAELLETGFEGGVSSAVSAGDECEAAKRLLFDFISTYTIEREDYYRFVRLQFSQRSLVLPAGAPTTESFLARRRFYPLAYLQEAVTNARAQGLPPQLVLSLIRAESFYRREAVSYSNALGLMQILPSTGRKIARRMGYNYFDASDLFFPAINIRFGSWYLAALVKEFKGQIPLALAAYNAGPFNVKRWLAMEKGVSMEEFIELIPFQQTRGYVKKILVYQYLYNLFYTCKISDLNLGAPVDSSYLDEINF